MYDIIAKIVDKLKDLPGAVETFKESLPGGASEQYVDDAVEAAVEGLASEEYVNTAVTGLASEQYVNERTFVSTTVTPPNNTANNVDLFGTWFGKDDVVADLPTNSGTYYYQMFFAKHVQIAIQYSSSGATGLFVRYHINDQWYPWKPLAMKASVDALHLEKTETIEIGSSVAIDADVSVALPSGYTYANTRVLSCYLFVNNTQYGTGFVHWYISSDNKIHAVNKSGAVGALQALIAMAV